MLLYTFMRINLPFNMCLQIDSTKQFFFVYTVYVKSANSNIKSYIFTQNLDFCEIRYRRDTLCFVHKGGDTLSQYFVYSYYRCIFLLINIIPSYIIMRWYKDQERLVLFCISDNIL